MCSVCVSHTFIENTVRDLCHAAESENPERWGGSVCVRVPAPGGQRPAEGSFQPHAAGQQPGQPDQPGQQHQGRRQQQQSQRLQQQASAGRPETQLPAGRQEVRRGGGAGSGTALHCQRQAVSLHRFLFEIQEGLELCLKGEQEWGSTPRPPPTMTPYPAPQSSRLTEEGWETPARMLVQEVGGTAGRSQICRDEVSLRTYAGCSSRLYCSEKKRVLTHWPAPDRDVHPASFPFLPFCSFKAPLRPRSPTFFSWPFTQFWDQTR